MALWLVRTGAHGEYEQRFLSEKRIYATWSGLTRDLSACQDQTALYNLLREVYPDFGVGKCRNYCGQLWPFVSTMQPGDWVVVPSKLKPAIHIGEITGPYHYDPNSQDPFYHSRTVKWIAEDVPRSNFDQDLLYSFGAFMTICNIARNDAERRVRAMGANKWAAPANAGQPVSDSSSRDDAADEGEVPRDLEEIARDGLARLILAKFKGHGLARLVDAVLRAEGYTTHLSPEGPDGGVDILAAPGAMGFGEPRLCVQVKSGSAPLERTVLDQLIGTMQNVNASQGLLVSWGGFKTSIDRQKATQFFRVRLWNRDDLIQKLLENYERLDEDLRAEIPLKRIWTVAMDTE